MAANKITQELYGGTVVIDHWPDSHRYRRQGQREYLVSVTGATSLLDKSRPLMKWAVSETRKHLLAFLESIEEGKTISPFELLPVIDEACFQYEAKKEAAADAGTQVHALAEAFAKATIAGEKMDETLFEGKPDNVLNGFSAFLDWYNSEKEVQFVAAEQIVYSLEDDYVGLEDAELSYGKKAKMFIPADYKTGKDVYNEAYYQLSLYNKAREEEEAFLAKKKERVASDFGLILHFNKEDGSFKVIERSRDEMLKDEVAALGLLAAKRREKELQAEWYAANKK